MGKVAVFVYYEIRFHSAGNTKLSRFFDISQRTTINMELERVKAY